MALSPPRAAGLRLSDPARLGLGLGLLLLNLVLCNVIAARHHWRGDWTGSRIYSLSPRSRALLAELRGPVKVTLLMVPPDRYQDSLYHEVRELLTRMRSHSSLLSLESLDIDADPDRAELLARRYSVSQADLAQGVVVVEAAGRSKYLTTSALAEYTITPEGRKLSAFHGEAALLGALRTVTAGEPPLVCFLQGHGEAAFSSLEPTGFGRLADEVRRDGYRTRAASPGDLLEGLPGCGLLVLGGPTRGFAPVELDALDRYLRRRGRLLVLLGPVLDRRVTRHGHLGIEDWLASWGARPVDNVVVDPLAMPGEQPLLTWAAQGGSGDHPIARALRGRLTVWPLAREIRPVPSARPELQAVAVVQSSSNGWGESDLGSLRGDRPLRLDPDRDAPGPVAVATASAWRESRLVVLGSERGLLNSRLADAPRDHNRELFLAALAWLSPGAPAPVAVGPRRPEHVRLLLDEAQLSRVRLITMAGMPLLSLLVGLLVWRRRRR